MNEKNHKHYYVTSPIYYTNDNPHIGHFYTNLACDVLTRFKKLDNYDVIFSTGTDEHGQKIEQRAKALNKSPKELVDGLSQNFKNIFDDMQFNYTHFIRTTEDNHKKTVQFIWQELEKKGFIYKGSYAGYYSTSDEAFYTQSEIDENEAGELIARESGSKVEIIDEESYFFKLSHFQNKLLDYYANNNDFIAPKSRLNEVVSFVKSGLKDLSISRVNVKWGIPVPTNPKHVMYVWLDALTNYLTVLGFPGGSDFSKFWPADLHVIGKDILRFHAVYWPAFLMALDIPLPKKIFAHGWWTNKGEKISKSKGNAIDIISTVDTYGLDEVRFFLLKEIKFGSDGDFNEQNLIDRINNELANDYGNLCHRTLSIIHKNFNGKINNATLDNSDEATQILEMRNTLLSKLKSIIDKQDFSAYIEEAFIVIRGLNSYINNQAPWSLIKNNELDKASNILYTIVEVIRSIAIILQPILPISSNKILTFLGVNKQSRTFSNIDRPLTSYNIEKPQVIFKKHLEDNS